MAETLFQLLAIYLFAALPWFAAWIANDGKKEDLWMPILGSLLLGVVLSLILFV